jgi:hypothetical protein
MNTNTNSGAYNLVDLWGTRARRTEAAHYQIAASYLRRNQYLSFAVIVLSATTGSGSFATLSTSAPKPVLRFVFGVIGIVAAVLAGLNRSLRYGERAEENRQAGSRWALIVSSAEKVITGLQANTNIPDADLAKQIDDLKSQIDDAGQRSPSIPQGFIKKAGVSDAYRWKLPSRRASRPSQPAPEPPAQNAPAS